MFQTTYDQNKNARNIQYPKASDQNFLAYNRELDLYKVSVVSPSGTSSIPVYLDSPIPISVVVDIETDSIKIYSPSGSPEIETWINRPVEVFQASPNISNLTNVRIMYDVNGNITEVREALNITPSGNQCVVKVLHYDNNGNIDYILDSLGSW